MSDLIAAVTSECRESEPAQQQHQQQALRLAAVAVPGGGKHGSVQPTTASDPVFDPRQTSSAALCVDLCRPDSSRPFYLLVMAGPDSGDVITAAGGGAMPSILQCGIHSDPLSIIKLASKLLHRIPINYFMHDFRRELYIAMANAMVFLLGQVTTQIPRLPSPKCIWQCHWRAKTDCLPLMGVSYHIWLHTHFTRSLSKPN